MNFAELSVQDFVRELSGKAPVPGGGGASALVGAVGTALGHMVGSLTIGKKKFKYLEPELLQKMQEAECLQTNLLDLIRQDAVSFEPLAAAYGLPKSTEAEAALKAQVLEQALKSACEVPLKIMEACCRAIDLQQFFAERGNPIAVSDAGAGALLCKSALMAASLNVFINTKAMTDHTTAQALNESADRMLAQFCTKADSIVDVVMKKIR